MLHSNKLFFSKISAAVLSWNTTAAEVLKLWKICTEGAADLLMSNFGSWFTAAPLNKPFQNTLS